MVNVYLNWLNNLLESSSFIPPVNQVTLLIKLSSLIIKAMSYFMTNHPSNGSIIEVPWSFTIEEHTLKYTSRKLYGVFYGRVESIDHCWISMPHPIKLINCLSETQVEDKNFCNWISSKYLNLENA